MPTTAPYLDAPYALRRLRTRIKLFFRTSADHKLPEIDTGNADALYQRSFRATCVDTDRLFASLMLLQWVVGVVLSLTISPRTWIGPEIKTHLHVWIAVILGGVVSSLPMLMTWRLPGHVLTRHINAAAQMMWSALLIHLTGGRLETHFHVFGSLAFLALYKDWRVIVTATLVIAGDHFVRGIWWPQSVFGVIVESPYRWIEHALWVLFEDAILVRSCIRGQREMYAIAMREAELFRTNQSLRIKNQECQQAESEVRQLYDVLAVAHQEAVAANETKSQFLANMSHELRTPLNAIIGYSEMLQLMEAKKKESMYTSDLQRINKAGHHLLNLINDILDISKIEAGKMQYELMEFDVRTLIEEIQDTVAPLAAKNGNTLTVQCDDLQEQVYADPIRLKQCLLNLLSNACKFTKEDEVWLSIRSEFRDNNSYIVFEIKDRGIGMSPEQVARLFQPFTQADASTTRKFGGTGLGLAITKQFCEGMGGLIELESELGQGSTFTILMPTVARGAKLIHTFTLEPSVPVPVPV